MQGKTVGGDLGTIGVVPLHWADLPGRLAAPVQMPRLCSVTATHPTIFCEVVTLTLRE